MLYIGIQIPPQTKIGLKGKYFIANISKYLMLEAYNNYIKLSREIIDFSPMIKFLLQWFQTWNLIRRNI